ncbi:hypothetical protein C4E22_01845 [ANME-1 cluster archaeon AG-394-G06]|nr:hypothetical protein [ANME-1 cluster archaeon AG-394-G06]
MESSKKKKNVILLTVECLRADRIGTFGYEKKTTPNLDELFKRGLLFSRAYSASSWTAPCINALLTSTYPFMYDGDVTMNKRTSIAEVLRNNGYTTIGLPFHAYLSSFFGYDKGFDTFKDGIKEKGNTKEIDSNSEALKYKIRRYIRMKFYKFDKLFSAKEKSILYKIWTSVKILRIGLVISKIALLDKRKKYPKMGERLNKEILSLLKNAHQPFFLWAHYLDTHPPFLPPKNFSRDIGMLSKIIVNVKQRIAMFENKEDAFKPKDLEKLSNLFDMEVEYLDFWIKNLMGELDYLGLLKDTYVIITADHGTQFLEHGRIHNELELYQELVHVPLFIMGPGIPCKEIELPVSHIDVSPTILDLLNINKPMGLLGKSLLNNGMNDRGGIGVFCEEGQSERGEAFQTEPGIIKLNKESMKIAYITKNRSYIFRNNGEDELYDLIKDPRERNNIINEEREMAEKCLEKIKEHLKEITYKGKSKEIVNIKRAIKKLRYGKGRI